MSSFENLNFPGKSLCIMYTYRKIQHATTYVLAATMHPISWVSTPLSRAICLLLLNTLMANVKHFFHFPPILNYRTMTFPRATSVLLHLQSPRPYLSIWQPKITPTHTHIHRETNPQSQPLIKITKYYYQFDIRCVSLFAFFIFIR